MPASAFVPAVGLKDVIFWSTIAFAFGGVESASMMADEIKDAARTVPRAILSAAETLGLTDRAYIIYSGEVLMEGQTEDIVNNPDVRRLYLGETFRM